MVFKGTPKRKPGQIEEEVKSYGGIINASTGLDSANYHVTVPREYLEKAISLMADITFNPAFDKSEMEKERQVILKEIKLNRDDPTRHVMRDLWQTSYTKHPYRMPVIGYEALFEGLKRDDLIKYHSSHYAADNLLLTVVGDIDRKKVLTQIKSAFGKYPRRRSSATLVPKEPQQNSLRDLKEYTPINLGYIAMGFHTVELSSKDLYALDILGIILGDWDGSRLNKKLVKENELLYAVSSFNYTPKYPGLFIIYGVGDYKKLEKAKGEILNEIKKISADGIEKSELDAAKNMVISGYIDLLETTGGLAKAISQSEFLAGDPAFFEKYVESVKKVDAKAVKSAARKYLNEDNLTISYLYPEYARENPLAEKNPANKTNISKTLLPNGMRLILKEDHRIPKVSLVSVFLGGIRVETKANNGISNLTSAMLLKGTKKRKEDQIKASMESLGGQISSFSGKNSFGISMKFLKENTRQALDMLQDVIQNPTFPKEELKKEKEKILAAIQAEDDDVYSTGFLRLKKMLFENYPYGFRILGEADSLDRITDQDMRNFHQKFCVPNNMVISIVGDFQPQKMRREIEKRFSRMGKIPLHIKAANPAPLSCTKEADFDMKRAQSLALVGFRGAKLKGPDKYRLQVLSSILSGENGRLYQAIRNELGLSYSLGTFSVPGIETGYIISYVATDKAHLKEAKDALIKELKKIKGGAISDKEIDLAKNALIGRQKISLQSYSVLAYKTALDEIYGIGYNAYKDYPQLISSITKKDIIKASKRYVDLDNFAVLTVSGDEND